MLAFALLGCDDDEDEDGHGDASIVDVGPRLDGAIQDAGRTDSSQPDAGEDQPELRAVMTGAQEVPRANTSASGNAEIRISDDETSITVSIEFENLSGPPTGAHIHVAPVGRAGPIIFPLAMGAFTSPHEATLNAADLTPAASIANFAEALQAIRDGRTYVNVHTMANPSGEIRGQIGAVRLGTVIAGAQELPAVVTAGSGSATVALSADQREIQVELDFSSLTNPMAAHIHFGTPGENGPVIFPLAVGAPMSPLTITLGEDDLMPVADKVESMKDAIAAILEGNAYVNVHTTANPGGEIRGQVGAVRMRAHLTGTQEVPPKTVVASGSASIDVGAEQDEITVRVDFMGVMNTTGAHIHVGGPGRNGPIIFPLAAGAFTSPIEITLRATDLSARPALGVKSFADAVSAIVGGQTYVNVHTMANPGGEIRGQIGAVRLASILSGAQETPPVTTTASGAGTVVLSADQRSVRSTTTFTGLMNSTAAHIHVAGVGTAGPIILPLADGAFTSPLTATSTEGSLIPRPASGVEDFGDAIDALLTGATYINLHTTTNPGGEIRGQIGPVKLTATLVGSSETPPVVTGATGTSTVHIAGDHSSVTVDLTHTNLTDITGAHIHVGPPGMSGPIVFPLAGMSFASPLSVVLTPVDLMAQPAAGISTFADAIAALLAGRMYVNVHTTANPGGEIRGQLRP